MSCFQFSVFLGLIFFLELTAGILAFVFKDWIKDQLNFFINNNVKAYRDDIDLQNLIDFAQEYVSLLILLCSQKVQTPLIDIHFILTTANDMVLSLSLDPVTWMEQVRSLAPMCKHWLSQKRGD